MTADVFLRRDPISNEFVLVRKDAAGADVEQLDEPVEIIKDRTEQQYVLGVAWEPGKQDRITVGRDGGRDFMNEVEVEKAAWRLLASGLDGDEVALFHTDGTEGHARVVESYVYRGPDWSLTNTAGQDVVIKSGTWLVGALLDDPAWHLYKTGRIGGLSTWGTATRRRIIPRSSS